MCMITHIIANTSGFGSPRQADGGGKIQFQADTRMEVTKVSPWDVGDKKVGQSVDWKIYYSSNGAKSYSCQSWLRFGKGIDNIQELLILCQELGLISKAGAWFTVDYLVQNVELGAKICNLEVEDGEYKDKEFIKSFKFQGQDKLYTFLSNNPDLCQELFKVIKEML